MQLSCTHWFWAQISQKGNWRLVTHRILRAVLVIGNPLSWIPTTGNLKIRGGRSPKIFFIPIHKVLDEPWRNLTSLKLCKCSHVPHLSPRVISTSNRTKTNHHYLDHLQTHRTHLTTPPCSRKDWGGFSEPLRQILSLIPLINIRKKMKNLWFTQNFYFIHLYQEQTKQPR